MVIYEVNLDINKQIFSEYYSWLVKHIELMLQFDGFMYAEVANETEEEDAKSTKITIRYIIKSLKDLESYLTHFAEQMRADAAQRFGEQFTSTRRIFNTPIVMQRRESSQIANLVRH